MKGFPTDNRHSYGRKLCHSPSRHIAVLQRSGINTVLVLDRYENVSITFNLTYRYIDDVLSINNPYFENYLGHMYPPEFEIKDTTESNTSASYLKLLLSIGRDRQLRTSLHDNRDDFNFHITNFPLVSSNVPSSRAYDDLSHNSSDTPGLALLMNVLFWRRHDFPISFSGRDMSTFEIVSQELLLSVRGLIKQYEVPLSRMLHGILEDDHIQWHPQLIRHSTNFWPYH